MGLLLTTVAGLILWIVLWALGFKSFDGFLFTMLFVILASAARMAMPSLPGSRPSPDEPDLERV